MDGQPNTFATAEDASSPAQRVVQILLLLIGLAAFLWLINIFVMGGDWAPDVAESLTQTVWALIVIPMLCLVFIGELVLFFFQPS